MRGTKLSRRKERRTAGVTTMSKGKALIKREQEAIRSSPGQGCHPPGKGAMEGKSQKSFRKTLGRDPGKDLNFVF